jgi:hypothetical protein
MNCQEVETMIADLARCGALEIEVRAMALAHVKQCERCGERFEDERKLSEGLLAFAAASIEQQAPPRVEERLRTAFRQHHAEQPVAAPSRGWGSWVTIAAAGPLAAAAILLFRLLAPVPSPPRVIKATAALPEPDIRVAAAETKPADVRPRNPPRGSRAVRKIDPTPQTVETEFIPVAQGDEWSPSDGARLMRVEIPKATLNIFGLPVMEGRGPDRVQADVVLSDDGLLRAIRFVR